MTNEITVFLYGTLCDPDLFRIVSGVEHNAVRGRLHGYRSVWAAGQNFTLILPDADSHANGLVVQVDREALDRMDFYELDFGYDLLPLSIETEDGPVGAMAYVPIPAMWQAGAPWSLADWQKRYGPLAHETATEFMRLYGTIDSAAAAQAFPQIQMRAASRIRARTRPSPHAFAPELGMPHVTIHDTRQPYTEYFAVREDDLSFPTFGGGTSAVVSRATFMGGDAVTVLPYDPKLDLVLVVRQFRHGAFARGDTNPWTLEPAAGRIDPGEDPEETARRELLEETGVTAEALHFVAEYYPSPGAYSEHLTSYVAIADLSGQDGTTSGLKHEHEDIMSHVVPFDTLMDLVGSGAANTGPLVLSALWLARHRESLRAAH